MSKKLRAKFIVNQVTDFGYGSKQAKMSAVYSNDKNKEDNQFSSATPSGDLNMMITAEGAQDFLEPGMKYYLTFEKCQDQS